MSIFLTLDKLQEVRAFFLITLIPLGIIRLVNLMAIPLFGDEALYLSLAEEIIKNPATFLGSIPWGVFPVTIWLQTPFHLLLGSYFNPLLLGRAVSVFFDLAAALFVFLIGRKLFDKKFAFIASIIYLSLPLNFFHGRVVLLESATNMLVLAAVFWSWKSVNNLSFYKKVDWLVIFAIAGLLSLSFFAKPLAVVSFGAVFLLPIFIVIEKKILLSKKLFWLFLNFALILVLTGILIALFYLPVAPEFTGKFIADNSTSPASTIIHFRANLWRVWWWSNNYLTIPVILLIFITMVFALVSRSWKLIWLISWVGMVIILDTFFSAHFYPRHLYPLAAPAALLAAYFLYKIFWFKWEAGVIGLAILLLPSWQLDMQIVRNPAAAIALEDRQQFFEDWSSGVGFAEVAQKLKQLSRDKEIVVYVENLPHLVWGFSAVYDIGQAKIYPSNNLLKDTFPEKTVNKESYIILNRNPVAPPPWPVKLVFSYPKGFSRTISLYKIIP